MLRSSNPILSKQDAFTPAAPQYGHSSRQYDPYGQPAGVRTRTATASSRGLRSAAGPTGARRRG